MTLLLLQDQAAGEDFAGAEAAKAILTNWQDRGRKGPAGVCFN
jgi:hypothetical protein